ncbi:MAG: hypothetical protein IPK16_19035 [Anaerolineales bacterium]|nr:hypothetical protein [Anaerolineales bacterium]
MALQEERVAGAFPEGTDLAKHVSRRKRTGSLWHGIFFVSTLVGILALLLLLGDVVDEAFGYAAIKETSDSQLLALNYHKQKMLSMPGTLASEDDQVLVNGVAARPNAIGFFGYSYYQNNQETLRSLPLDGVTPDAATVESGSTTCRAHSISTRRSQSWKTSAPSRLTSTTT